SNLDSAFRSDPMLENPFGPFGEQTATLEEEEGRAASLRIGAVLSGRSDLEFGALLGGYGQATRLRVRQALEIDILLPIAAAQEALVGRSLTQAPTPPTQPTESRIDRMYCWPPHQDRDAGVTGRTDRSIR